MEWRPLQRRCARRRWCSVADAAARLPDLGRPTREAARATGTYNAKPVGRTEAGCDIAPQIAPNAAHKDATPSKSLPASAGVSSDGTVPGNHTEIGRNERTTAHQSAREWMGIEPTRRRANDASTALKAAGPCAQVVEEHALNASPSADCTTSCTNEPELAAVVTAWPELPEAVKAGIVAMVQAAKE